MYNSIVSILLTTSDDIVCTTNQTRDEDNLILHHNPSMVPVYSVRRLVHLIITTIPPLSYYVIRTDDQYSGLYVDLLDMLATEVGFTYSFIYPRTRQWGVITDNGTWTGG